MTIPTLTPLGTPPSRADSATFAVRADAFLGSLPTLATEINSTITATNSAVTDVATKQGIASAAAVSTAADVVLTHADVVLTHADATQTALDRVQTGDDVDATAADRVQTAADRVQTGLDRAAAAASAASASAVSGLPAFGAGDAGKAMVVNAGETAYTLALLGSLVRSARTANTILSASDKGKLIDVTSGTFTQTFAACSALGDGWICYLRNSGTGVVTCDPNASETIGGCTTATLNPGDLWIVQCNGTSLSLLRIAGHNQQIYTSGVNTFTVPAGVYRIFAEAWGGGGGGCRYSSALAPGAGGGGYAADYINVVPGATITATVGAAGVGRKASDGDGTAGGNTTFSALVANGGFGQVAGGSPVSGGTASGGSINIPGTRGWKATGAPSFGGHAAKLSTPGAYQFSSFATVPSGFGGGGASAQNENGQDGTSGAIIIKWV